MRCRDCGKDLSGEPYISFRARQCRACYMKAGKNEASETVNLKKRELQMTEDLKYLIIKAIRRIRIDFNTLIKSEEEAIKQYEYAVGVYGSFGWREIFSGILKDEREHLEKLRICLGSIEEVYKLEGHIKS